MRRALHELETSSRARAAAVPTWARTLGGVALVVVGIVLVGRPMTSLVALAWSIGIGLVALGIGVFLERYGARVDGLVLGVASVAAGVTVLVGQDALLGWSPWIVAALLVVLGVRRIVHGIRGDRALRMPETLLGACSVALGVLAVAWQDVTVTATAIGFGVWIALWGVRIAARPVLDALGRRPRLRGGRTVLRWTAAIAAVALVAGSGWVTARVADGAPTIDAFYDVDGPIPESGTLLRVAGYDGTPVADATSLRILYATTDAQGEPALASAVVAYPDAPASEDRLVLSVQHGTVGIARGCAPSLRDDALSDLGVPGIDDAIARGWVVVATDYAGMGTAGSSPYLVGEGEARSALDAIRATRQLDDADASARAMILGHSQGGHASLWTGEIAREYAPELEIVGVAALAPASDPLGLARVVTVGSGGAVTLITSYVVTAYAGAYDDVRLDDLVDPAARVLVAEAASRCTTSPGLLATLLTSALAGGDRPLFRLDLDEGPIVDRLEQNRATTDLGVPVLIAQGTADEVVPVGLQRDFVDAACAAGESPRYVEYENRTHMGLIDPDGPLVGDLYDWFDAVLAGSPPPTTCP